MKISPRPMSLAEFARLNNGTTLDDVNAHTQGALRSKPQPKTFARFFEKRLNELLRASEETTRLYREAIARGEIVEPTSNLNETALLDTERGAAARRVLAKRAERVRLLREATS